MRELILESILSGLSVLMALGVIIWGVHILLA
jgi:hypothetical protein